MNRLRGFLESKRSQFEAIRRGLSDFVDDAIFCHTLMTFHLSANEPNYDEVILDEKGILARGFKNAVNKASDLGWPIKFTALLYQVCFPALQCACGCGLWLVDMGGLLGRLRCSFKHFTSQREQHDQDIQAPLVNIVDKHVECQISTATCSSSGSLIGHLETVRSKIQETTNKLQDDAQSPHDSEARFVVLRKIAHCWNNDEVQEVRDLETGHVFARKVFSVFNKTSTNANFERQVTKEYEIMATLRHDHIVKATSFSKEKNSLSIYMTPVAEQNLRTYLEDCPDNLFDANLLEPVVQWFGCLLDALQSIHRLDIVHRDIKSSNILIKNGQVFLADFGLAEYATNDDSNAGMDFKVCGSPTYRAPEVIAGQQQGKAADIFALGCVFSEMLTVYCRKSIADYEEYREEYDEDCPLAFGTSLPKVRSWLHGLQEPRTPKVCETLFNLTTKMLQEDPRDRPIASEALKLLERL